MSSPGTGCTESLVESPSRVDVAVWISGLGSAGGAVGLDDLKCLFHDDSMILCPHNSSPSPSCEGDEEGHGGAASRRAWRELGEEMHIHEVWAGHFDPCSWSCSLSTAWFSAGWETGRNAKLQPQSRPGAELFPMQLLVDSRAGSVRTCPWLGPWVLPAESEPRIALCRQLQFPPGDSRAFRTWHWLPWGCPLSHPGTESGMCVLPGDHHPKKGKSCLLAFPAPTLLPHQWLGTAGSSPAQGYVLLLLAPGQRA